MIPWIRLRGNPLMLLPHLVVLVAAGLVLARIVARNELETGRDIGYLLIVAALVQTALVLDLFLQLAIAYRVWRDELSPTYGCTLEVARRLQWVLLVAPAAAIILVARWPTSPHALRAPAFDFAWALTLFNMSPIIAGYLLLWLINPRVAGRKDPDDIADHSEPVAQMS